MQSRFASLRICSTRKEHTVLDVREARELDICQLEGALHVPMAEIPARVDDLPTNQPLWSFAITALAVSWSSTFSETPALTMPSTSRAASKPGPTRSTSRYGAIDSVHPKRNLATHAAD
jgi:hypothetical protein